MSLLSCQSLTTTMSMTESWSSSLACGVADITRCAVIRAALISWCVQSRIALVNTGLTCLGMYLLAIPGIGLQSLFVFICSFIPIAGCFISTIPIAFVALTEYGFFQVCYALPFRYVVLMS